MMAEQVLRPTILALAIRTRREAMGLSQNELGKRSEVERGYIAAYERGERQNLSWDVIEKLARGLETTVADLLLLAGSYRGDGDTKSEVTISVNRTKAPLLKALDLSMDQGALAAIEQLVQRLSFKAEDNPPEPLPPA